LCCFLRKVRAHESPEVSESRYRKHSPLSGAVNRSFVRPGSAGGSAGAAHAAENGERITRECLPDELSARLDAPVDAGSDGVRVLARGAADDQVAPLADRPVAVGLELLCERLCRVARAAVDPHLPWRVAVVELLLLPGLGRRLVVPPLLGLEPVLDAVRAAGERTRALGLGPRVRIDEDVVAVPGDREAALVVARLSEPLQEGVWVVGRDVDPEVVYAGILPYFARPACSRCFVSPPRKNG